MDSFYILDGMALIYRAFYAFINAPMRTATGLNTSAMFGFVNTVTSIIDKEQPTHIVACLDPSGPTFRHKRFPAYKATRQAMPEELRNSVPWIIDLLSALNIKILRIPGYEADDLIGTLTRLADEQGNMQTYMVSKDKDLGQLLSPTCSFYRPGKKDFEIVRQDQFLEEWGISRPEQTIDILSLMGDSSDNIPGIPGVGEVTARKLISQFGSLEALLSNTSQLKGKMRQKIEEHAETAKLSRELATIVRNVPLPVSIGDCRRREYNTQTLRELLDKLEFHKLAAKLCPNVSGGAAPPAAADEGSPHAPEQLDLFSPPTLADIHSTPHRYILVDSPEKRDALAEALQNTESWAFDTETTGLNPLEDKLLGISFSLREHEAYYVPISCNADAKSFQKAFASPSLKIGLNVKFDWQVLRNAELDLSGPFFDVMLAHAALYPDLRHNMNDMAEALLAYKTIHLEDIAGKEIDTASVSAETMCDYAAEDADVTLRLANLLRPRLKAAGMERLMQEIEFPLAPVLAAMEMEGMRIDPAQLQHSSEQLGKQIEVVKNRIDTTIGRSINLNSPRQLGDLLFGEMKLMAKPKKTRTGQYVTDEETLRKLRPVSPLVNDILEYRELAKLKGTYLDALPRYISAKDGRIHSTLQQMVTATGRLASQNPNLQNIPVRSEAGKLIRRAFIARDQAYSILSADYSQVELRLMAALSGDPSMIEAFREKRDIHAETAAKLYGIPREHVTSDMRRAAKTVNFGIIYGISAFGLSQRLDCTRSEAASLIESYFTQFPGVKKFMDQLVENARAKGYAETLCGRRRPLPDLNNSNFNLRAAAERTAINTPIQGSAADMIKIAMIRVASLLKGRRSRLIMQIHDELLIDLHKDEAIELTPLICNAMSSAMPLPHNVPLEVEANAADNWLDAH